MARTFFILKAGIAPPGLAHQPAIIKLMFWSWVVDLGLRRKDWELARGLNAKGEPLPGIAPATRKRRRSDMTPSGRGDPSAPYLMPGRGLSRTRSLLTGKAHADYAEFFWRYDAHTGDQWGRVLAWHAARGKSYDVVGLSPAGIAIVAQQAQKRWRQWLLSSAPIQDLRPPGPVQPIQRPAAHRVDGGRSESVGRTNLTFATEGVGSISQYQKALDEGRAGGLRTQAEWERYLREKRAPIPLASPGTTSYSVRRGASNVVLQALYKAPPPPAAQALRRAAMPPTPAAPVVATKPAIKPAPEPVKAPAASPPAFAPSTATVEYGGWNAAQRKKAERVAARVLKGVPPERYASIIGAPDGSTVRIDDGGEEWIMYDVSHPSLAGMRGELNRSSGELRHDPYHLYVKESERGKGVGAEVHGRRVAFGAEHGVTRIKITAARGDEEVGYIVWPTLGYDGRLPKSVVERLPEQLKGRATIQELLADEGGQKWWKVHGESIDMTFDLKPDSRSIARWTAYWARKLLGRRGG